MRRTSNLLHRYRLLRHESLEKRSMLAASVLQVADTAYFVSDSEPLVGRYDITEEEWLSPINLPADEAPTAGHVDADGIYVAYGRAVYRYDLDGRNEEHLFNTSTDVIALHSDESLLLINHSSGLYARAVSINKVNQTVIDTAEEYIDSIYGSSIDRTNNRLFGRTSGISPSDITFLDCGESGVFGNSGGSPYHGDYPGASKTWVFPDDSKVVDDSGTVYSTDSLTWLNSFGTRISDIAFRGNDIPIVVDGSTLMAFDNSLLPAGMAELDHSPQEIFVNSTNVITFTESPANENGFVVNAIPLNTINAPEPGDSVDPVGLSYVPDEIEVAADGSLLIYSQSHSSVFRWDVASRQYTQSIPLIGSPSHMTYSAANDTVYLAYQSGLIRKIDLSESVIEEVPFATMPGQPLGLEMAGEYVFAVDPSGAWNSHYTYTPEGMLISSVDWNYSSSEYVWNDATGSMYFLRSSSPTDLIKENIADDGSIGTKSDTPLHTSAPFRHPIRVSPDGTRVVLGTGAMFDAETLDRFPESLPYDISDAVWVGKHLFTMRNLSGVSQVQAWSQPTFAPGAIKQSTNEGISLVNANGLIVSVTSSDGVPRFDVLDLELEPSDGTVASEIRVDFQGQAIENNDTTPSSLEGTNFGTVARGESNVSHHFEISNSGNEDLILSTVSLPPGYELGISRGAFDENETISIQPGDEVIFIVTLLSDQVGEKSGEIRFATNAPDDLIFSVAITGQVESDGTLDTIGLFEESLSVFHLKDEFSPGSADHYFSYGPATETWSPLIGDWNGDGTDGIGLFQPDLSLFHLKNEFSAGASDEYFAFGPADSDWVPLAGDWNGDGIDTIGLYQPDLGLFHLKDTFTAGPSDQYFRFGPGGNAGWTPLVGDWDGDGADTIGLYQPDISLFHLKDSFSEGASDHYFAFGPGRNAGWVPLAGDWNGDGV
ncbi:MAG: hypothetical protein AAFV88_09555, partial [Planctomycetota bacterium]